MERLEEKKEKLTLELSDSSKSNQQIMELGNELAKIVAELEKKSDRWLELAEFV